GVRLALPGDRYDRQYDRIEQRTDPEQVAWRGRQTATTDLRQRAASGGARIAAQSAGIEKPGRQRGDASGDVESRSRDLDRPAHSCRRGGLNDIEAEDVRFERVRRSADEQRVAARQERL